MTVKDAGNDGRGTALWILDQVQNDSRPSGLRTKFIWQVWYFRRGRVSRALLIRDNMHVLVVHKVSGFGAVTYVGCQNHRRHRL